MLNTLYDVMERLDIFETNDASRNLKKVVDTSRLIFSEEEKNTLDECVGFMAEGFMMFPLRTCAQVMEDQNRVNRVIEFVNFHNIFMLGFVDKLSPEKKDIFEKFIGYEALFYMSRIPSIFTGEMKHVPDDPDERAKSIAKVLTDYMLAITPFKPTTVRLLGKSVLYDDGIPRPHFDPPY